MPALADDAGVVIVYGADPALVSQALTAAIRSAAGDDGALAVEHGPLSVDLLTGCDTLPMFVTHRVVVARDASSAPGEAVAALVAYAACASPSTRLIVEWSSQKLPAALAALAKAGIVSSFDANAPRSAGERTATINARLRAASVDISGPARVLVVSTIGEDLSRLAGIVSVLEASFTPGSVLGPNDVAPYLGDAGAVPTWDLTDAITAGDAPKALLTLSRLLRAGGRHPLVVAAVLRSHYARMWRVAATDVVDEAEAAQLLGLKGSTFPARKAVTDARRLGIAKIEAALLLVSPVAAALKGGSGVGDRLIVEVLVGRLASLHRR